MGKEEREKVLMYRAKANERSGGCENGYVERSLPDLLY